MIRLTLCLLALWSSLANATVVGADLILKGGTVYSMDTQGNRHSSIALAGKTILAVGNDSDVALFQTDATEVVDLAGRVVFPGFIDTHIHTMDTLPLLNGVMLSPGQSAEEVLAAIAEHAQLYPDQNPVLGSGFLARAFGIDGPTAAQLDAVVPDRPALIIDEGGHTAWANSLALTAADITASTPDPVPGAHFFQRDMLGNPTGWLVEGAAIDPVSDALGLVSEEALRDKAPGFFHDMSAVGLTAAFDAGMIDTMGLGMRVASELAQSNELPLRLVGSLYINKPKDLETAHTRLTKLKNTFDHELFSVTTLKLSLDGTVEAKTAVTLEPYIAPEGHEATPLLTNQQVFNAVYEAYSLGFDLHLHAIGDGAVRTALDAIEAGQKAHPDADIRATICHIEVVNKDDIARFGELGVVAQTTPTWFEYDEIAMEFLGPARFEQLYPLASIHRNGGRVTLGSDYPVSWIGKDALNPMFNIEMAVTRQRAGTPDYPVQARENERLSVDQAIRAHTIDAAWQIRLEDEIGSLEAGKKADLVVLESDPYTADPYSIHAIEVDLTISNGRIVFERENTTGK
ncbi:putative TIM-barrel fold metal-dependent hydrolase [gamma proteobacterium HIMB55]|nr:putative TIM-barrel fold metal-dependent hydrolase [gamma proteobacterium HIMB55]